MFNDVLVLLNSVSFALTSYFYTLKEHKKSDGKKFLTIHQISEAGEIV